MLVKFRNICAHDERLYCARVDKRNPVDYFGCVSYASKFMPSDEYVALLRGIAALAGKDSGLSKGASHVILAMGFEDFVVRHDQQTESLMKLLEKKGV